MKSILFFILKVIVSIGSLYIVTRSIEWEKAGGVLIHAKFSLILLALVIFLIAQLFSALRCVYIARVLGGVLDLSVSIRAHFVGLWFNQVMPTSLGGDVIKIAILRNNLGLSMAIRSTILDRLSGLIFLLLITAITLPLYDNLFSSHPEFIIALGVIAIGGVSTIILSAWGAHHVSKLSIHNSFILKLLQIISDAWAFRKGVALCEQVWTSAIVHFNGIVTYALIGYAIGVDVNLVTFILVVPIIFLIALIPVSFAGWGVREAGAIWLFGMIGVAKEHALAMSVSFGLLLIVAGLPGLFILLINKSSTKAELDVR